MAERYPALRPQLSEAGEIQGALNLFINGEHIRYRGGLAAPLQDGDVVHIVPIISGGSR
jgi:molybdopterin converting factor small subunit